MTQQKNKNVRGNAQTNRASSFLFPAWRAGKACAAIQKSSGTRWVHGLFLFVITRLVRVMTVLTVALCLLTTIPAHAACPGSCGDDKDERVVFVSNAEVAAQSLGGISGGDALCQSWADAAGLQGNYFAWLGDNTTDPATRFEQSTVPYVMVNGTKIADDWTDLTDGTLDSLFRVTQTNGTNDGFALSNVDTDGTVLNPNATQHCNNFTSNAGGAIIQIGRNQFTNFNWTRASNSACTSTFPLYCFEQQTSCSNPAGHTGEIIFDRNYRAMEYCNGTDWISMGKEASVLHGQKTTSEKQMIAWYRMDATSGTEETDYSPIGNTGTFTNVDPATDSEPGISGTALDFSNNTAETKLSITNPVFNDLDTVTISAWVKSDGTYDGVMGIAYINQLFRLRAHFNSPNIRFEMPSWTSPGTWVSGANLTPGTWQHIVVAFSYNDPVGTAPKIYLNGVLQGGYFSVSPSGTFTPMNGGGAEIGGRNDASGGNFHGLIDDVRIYNYVLSDDEIAEIYAASDLAYQPNAVAFDGADYLEENALAVSPSPRMTFSTWFRVNDFAARRQIFENLAANVWLYVQSDGRLHFRMETLGNIAIFGTTLDGTGIGSSTDWHHLLLSVDTASPGRIQAYLDDVEIHNSTGAIVPTDVDIAFGNLMRIGRSIAVGGTAYMNGDIADFWMDVGTYIDLSDADNRRKFISAAGEAVFLGNNGELVTGDPPDIFLSGDTDSWHTNKGAGGGFTENGALTNAATEPPGGASIIPRYCADPVQPAGTLVYNSSENVMQYCDGYEYIPLSAPGLGAGGCVSPSGLAGEMIFNTSVNSLQYCDGSGWVGVGDAKMIADPCAGTPSVGDTCADGTIYAGLSPDGGVAMYTMPADAGQLVWNDGTSNWYDIPAMSNCTDDTPGTASSCQTGEANTDLLVSFGTTPSPAPYVAAQYCYCLGKPLTGVCSGDPTSGAASHGHADWYLPAQDELNVLWESLVDQNGDNTPGGPLGSTFGFDTNIATSSYWSSSEINNFRARYQQLSDGFQFRTSKSLNLSIRCVRK